MAGAGLAISGTAATRSIGQMEEVKTALGPAFSSSSIHAYYAPTDAVKIRSIEGRKNHYMCLHQIARDQRNMLLEKGRRDGDAGWGRNTLDTTYLHSLRTTACVFVRLKTPAVVL